MIIKVITKVYNKLVKVFDSIIVLTIKLNKKIEAGQKLKVFGRPIIYISGGEIIIGNNVTLHSKNVRYHTNMHSPVKLMVDRENALIKIGNNSRINGACIHAYSKIEVGQNCLIAANVQIIDSNGHDLCFDNVQNRIHTSSVGKDIVIEDNVWIGVNAVILPGVRIGYGSVIGANTVVSTDVPPMVIYSGNPGRIIKNYNNIDIEDVNNEKN